MNLVQPLSRAERRKAQTTAAILDAAERHLLEHGHEAARVDEIAADADVAVGSIYNHFGSKDGLYVALARRALDLLGTYMDENVERDRPPLEQLLDVAGRLARFGREHPGHLRLLAIARRDASGSKLADLVARELADRERRTAALIEAAVRRGEARPLNARHAAAFLWSAWLGMLALGSPGDSAVGGVAEAGLRIVVGGLASDRSRESSEVVRAILESAPAAPAAGAVPSLVRLPLTREVRMGFPGLAVWTATVPGRLGRAPEALERRLRESATASRITGAEAMGVPPQSTPWAYRVFARRAGVDPEAPRPAAEEIALRRGPARESATGLLPADALSVVALETGIPLVALDADRLEGRLHLRLAEAGERVGAAALGGREPVVADLAGAVAVMLGPVAEGREVTDGTTRVVLAALQVNGVPDVGVQEALWMAVEILAEARS